MCVDDRVDLEGNLVFLTPVSDGEEGAKVVGTPLTSPNLHVGSFTEAVTRDGKNVQVLS